MTPPAGTTTLSPHYFPLGFSSLLPKPHPHKPLRPVGSLDRDHTLQASGTPTAAPLPAKPIPVSTKASPIRSPSHISCFWHEFYGDAACFDAWRPRPTEHPPPLLFGIAPAQLRHAGRRISYCLCESCRYRRLRCPSATGRCTEASPRQKSIARLPRPNIFRPVWENCIFPAESKLECGNWLAARATPAIGHGRARTASQSLERQFIGAGGAPVV